MLNHKQNLFWISLLSKKNVPTYRFFLDLPRRKVMIYFFQKAKKMGVTDFGDFWREHYPKNTLNLKKLGFVSE